MKIIQMASTISDQIVQQVEKRKNNSYKDFEIDMFLSNSIYKYVFLCLYIFT